LMKTQEHVVQWHPTILTKLALVPQRIMNAYPGPLTGHEGSHLFEEEDFVIRFAGCETNATRSCEKEMEPYYYKWKQESRTLSD
ncbi:MAG: hypothetical protein M1830_006174, partial [Pleopsidium flavum]